MPTQVSKNVAALGQGVNADMAVRRLPGICALQPMTELSYNSIVRLWPTDYSSMSHGGFQYCVFARGRPTSHVVPLQHLKSARCYTAAGLTVSATGLYLNNGTQKLTQYAAVDTKMCAPGTQLPVGGPQIKCCVLVWLCFHKHSSIALELQC